MQNLSDAMAVMSVLSLEPAQAYRQLVAGLAVMAWSIKDDRLREQFFDTVRADLPVMHEAIRPEFDRQFAEQQKAGAA